MKRFKSFIKCDTLCMPFDDYSLKNIGLPSTLIKELCQRLVEKKWLKEPVLFSKLISAQIFTTSRKKRLQTGHNPVNFFYRGCSKGS